MKIVFITGANRGLGLEFTRQYLENGDRVVASCRAPDKAVDLAELKQTFPETLLITKLDVTNLDERDDAFEFVKNKVGRVDILINNAGIISGDAENISVLGEVYKEDFSLVFLVNSIAPLLMSEKLLPLIEESENGRIIMMSSLNGSITKRTVGGKYSYATSKAALNMITKILSNDLRDKGIVTIAVHPGWLQTDMGGPEAPDEKEGPISEIIQLIERIDLSDSGNFLDRTGTVLPW
jgi:NAD(P)-dependent dehydrogenase (short-subunit alcohol dehydrogenase family)